MRARPDCSAQNIGEVLWQAAGQQDTSCLSPDITAERTQALRPKTEREKDAGRSASRSLNGRLHPAHEHDMSKT